MCSRASEDFSEAFTYQSACDEMGGVMVGVNPDDFELLIQQEGIGWDRGENLGR